MNISQGVINLQTYSRPHLLAKCLDSIFAMENIDNYKKLFVLQIGNSTVEQLIYKRVDSTTEIIEVDGKTRSPLENMNFNRWLALQKAFERDGCDWVLSIEEDVEVAPETLIFIEEIYAKYKYTKDFRGINLGSILSSQDLLATFSLQRFGVHGCGSVLTKETWNRMKKLKIERTLKEFALDGAIEGITKSGFMVTPNVTLYLDHGWDSGTHNKSSYFDTHFVLNRQSWQARISSKTKDFKLQMLTIPWREDCVPYNKRDNIEYSLRCVKSRLYHTSPYQSYLKLRRSTKRFLKYTKKSC